ncbi:MAG: hypothetical protein NW215_01360 [Hyphomicrobiales bacterium]|nr:hypothetical protein [Hyphomicrobiales bacterium]
MIDFRASALSRGQTLTLLIALTAGASTLPFSQVKAFECEGTGSTLVDPSDGNTISNTACGDGAQATGGSFNSAYGNNANATAPRGNAVAVGGRTLASGNESTAIGTNAQATGAGSIAIGSFGGNEIPGDPLGAQATGTNAIAIGTDAEAIGTNSIAIGAGVFSRPGEVSIGASSNFYRFAGLGSAPGENSRASSTFDTSNIKIMVADTTGNVAAVTAETAGVATTAQVETVNNRVTTVDNRVTAVDNRVTVVDNRVTGVDNRVTVVFNQVAAVDNRVTVVETQVTELFARDEAQQRQIGNLQDRDEELAEGIAIALSLDTPTFLPGQDFALRAGWGNFDGADAFGVTAGGVLDRGSFGRNSSVILDGGVGFGVNTNTVAGKAGLSFGW